MTGWEVERLALQIVFLVLFFRIMFDLKRLVEQGQEDRRAREAVILELKETAVALAKRTETILAASEARGETALQSIQQNTKDTATATRESADVLKADHI